MRRPITAVSDLRWMSLFIDTNGTATRRTVSLPLHGEGITETFLKSFREENHD